MSAVDAYVQARRPLTANVLVYAATPRVVALSGVVYAVPGALTQAQAAVGRELTALQREVPIGGTLYRSRIIEALFARPHVTNVVLSSPTGDIALGATEALVLDVSGIVYEEAA